MSRRYQFELIQNIRNFFLQEGFLDVLTPSAVENPGMEVHIHPFRLNSTYKNQNTELYLHTSPEFCMKELLVEGFEKIFTMSYCFRDEPTSPIHRPQFVMLEWYRANENYNAIMRDVENLIAYVLQNNKTIPIRKEIQNQTLIKKTMQELFQEELGVDILNYLELNAIKNLLKQFPDVPVPEAELQWDDYFFLLYLNKIEPAIVKYPILMITEFPAPLSALSTLKKEDPRVCERFEVYINGIEICNCFNELTDAKEQKRRFTEQNKLKKELYHYSLPSPETFYKTMDKGLPKSAGIALGVERLLHTLFEVENPFFS